jgi:hypothetical protein
MGRCLLRRVNSGHAVTPLRAYEVCLRIVNYVNEISCKDYFRMFLIKRYCTQLFTIANKNSDIALCISLFV